MYFVVLWICKNHQYHIFNVYEFLMLTLGQLFKQIWNTPKKAVVFSVSTVEYISITSLALLQVNKKLI